MKRRLLATLTLTACVSSGMILFSAPAGADDLCIGGDNQRKPGSYQGLCVNGLLDGPAPEVRKLLGKIDI